MAESFPVLLDLKINNGGKKVYFASDFHLGAKAEKNNSQREKIICNWLDSIKSDASHILLVGDIFDFWFEYKHSIPKGYSRFLGKIRELRDQGIEIYFFTGNHDMWMFDYFPKEYGIPILRKNQILKLNDLRILIGHGDGLGPGDRTYKFLKAFFSNRLCQFLFEWLHPNLGMALANYWSSKSRISNNKKGDAFHAEKEFLLIYCNSILEKEHFDYFIFGHRHLPLNIQLKNNSKYINLGEWVNHFTFATYDGSDLSFKSFTGKDDLIINKDFSS